MEEAFKLFSELKGVLGSAAAIGLSAFVYLWSQKNSRDASNADTAGQIKALGVYEEMLKTEREAKAQAEQRADQFAKERNEAYQQVWELKGQMKAMTDQLQAQNQELAQLRDQVRALKEQIDAKP